MCKPKQKTIQACGWTLFTGAVVATILGICMIAFTAQIGEHETFNLLVNSALQSVEQVNQALTEAEKNLNSSQDKVKIEFKPMVILGGICIGLTALGVLLLVVPNSAIARFVLG